MVKLNIAGWDFEINSPWDKKKNKNKEKKIPPSKKEVIRIEKNKNWNTDITNTINNFDSSISKDWLYQSKIPKEKWIIEKIQDFANTHQNYEYDEDILDGTNVYKRTWKQISPVEEEYIEKKKKFHAEFLYLKKSFEKKTRNINEKSKREIEILFEQYKVWVAKEELAFLKKKINNFNGQLIRLEDNEKQENKDPQDPLYKYMFKYAKIRWEKIPTEEEKEKLRDFIENFLVFYSSYINENVKNNVEKINIKESLKQKKWLWIHWSVAVKEIIFKNNFLIDKLLEALNCSGKERIYFQFKWDEKPFYISKKSLEDILKWKVVILNNENKKESIEIEEENEINIEAIADKLDKTVSIDSDNKEILIDFLRNYNQWYPKDEGWYEQIKMIQSKLLRVGWIITKTIKDNIGELIDIKEKELSKREIKMLRKVDKADISKKSTSYLKSLIIDLKENWLGPNEESFVFTQVDLHSKLQTISLEVESGYHFENTDIYNDINLLKEESLWIDDIIYIENKVIEIKNNIAKFIEQPEFQKAINDSDQYKKVFKKTLLSIYINKRIYAWKSVDIQELKETELKKIIKNSNSLQPLLKALVGRDGTTIYLRGIKFEQHFQNISKKLEEAEKEEWVNFNLINFFLREWLPESVIEITNPFLRTLLIKKYGNVFKRNENIRRSEAKIKKLQRQFSITNWENGSPLYTWAIDGKYSSIEKSVEKFQHENDIVNDDSDWGIWNFGNKTREVFNPIYLKQLKEKESIEDIATPEEIKEIFERFKLLHIYILNSWWEWKMWVTSAYLHGNEHREWPYGQEVYNNNEVFQKELEATKSIYKKLDVEKEEWLWVKKELSRPSAKQELKELKSNWFKDEELIPILNMKNGRKASYILKMKWKSDSRTPANLSAQKNMITFSAGLSLYKGKDLEYLSDFLLNWNTRALRKIHKKHFWKYPWKESRIFTSKSKYPSKDFYEKIATHIRSNINESTEKSSVPYMEYENFMAKYENIAGIGVSKKFWAELTKITRDKWWSQNTCGPAAHRLWSKHNISYGDIIKGRRDGYRFEKLFDDGVKKWLFLKVRVTSLDQLVAGSFIVYGKDGLWSSERKKYGHVEAIWEKMKGSEIIWNKRITRHSPSWKKEVENDKTYNLGYSYYRSTILWWSSYFYSIEKYEKDVISWNIDDFEIFKATTKMTGFMYIPLKNRR